MEALSHDLPIVWSNVRGLDEVLGDAPGCVKFDLNQEGSFKNSLNEVFLDIESDNLIPGKRSEYAKRFNFANTLMGYQNIYDQIFNRI